MVPGKTTYRQVCENIAESRTETYYVQVPVTTTNTVKRCTPSNKQQCTSYQIPEYKVESEEKTATVDINVPVCK